MTLEEALAELGLEPGADPEAVRRSYLRLIKERKPEADPAGFKRARLAYETARAGTQLEAFAVQVERRYEPAEPPRSAAPEPPAAADADEPAPVDASFEAFMAEWQAVPAMDRFKKLAIARAAVAALPGEPRAHWLVVNSMAGFMGDAQIAQALRDGYKAGFEEFLEALLIRSPDRATRAEVNAAFASQTDSLRLLGAAVGADRDSERSAALVVELCARDASDPSRVPLGPMLEVILALHQADAVPDALRAHAAVQKLLRDGGLEVQLASGDLRAIWMLAEELASLPDDSPIGLRTAFAAASRAGDLQSAFYDAYDAIQSNRGQVERWTDRLRGAPNIVAVLHAAFAHDDAQRRSDVRSGFFRAAAYSLLAVLGLVIIRVVTSSSGRAADEPPLRVLHPSEPSSRAAAELEAAWRAGIDLCGPNWRSDGRLSCHDVQETLAALEGSHCDTIRPMMRNLMKQIDGHAPTDKELVVVARISAARARICSTRSSAAQDLIP